MPRKELTRVNFVGLSDDVEIDPRPAWSAEQYQKMDLAFQQAMLRERPRAFVASAESDGR